MDKSQNDKITHRGNKSAVERMLGFHGDKKGNDMICMICGSEGETKHLPLYIIGSEGLEICQFCEMALSIHIKYLRNLAGKSRMLGFKQAKSRET